MIFVIILVLISPLILLFYSALKISSECSKEEEKRELLWQQQEYGKLKKD